MEEEQSSFDSADEVESSDEDLYEDKLEAGEDSLTFEDVVSFTMLMEFAITFVSIIIFMGVFIYSIW